MKNESIVKIKDARKIHGLVCLKDQIQVFQKPNKDLIRNGKAKAFSKRLQLNK